VGKLVRDRIPEIIEGDGGDPRRKTLDDAGYEAALLDKLDEEVAELRDAAPPDRLEEAADVYEVLLALVDHLGHDWADVVAAAGRKRAERGGFADRVFLDSW